MVLTSFKVDNKLGRSLFFQETFLVANTSVEIVLGIPLLTISNAGMQFVERKLT